MRKTIAYIRVSTQEQANGHSFAAQHAAATGRVIDETIVDDGKSAKSRDRLLEMVRRGEVASVLIVLDA